MFPDDKSRARRESTARAALGFRVKSGWATAVLLAGPVHSPQVLNQARVELSDPAVPESLQPYHAGTGALETNETKVSQRLEIVRQWAHESVTKLLQDYRNHNWIVYCSGLALGSTTEPATIPNPHIRAHAFEGRLFRTVLEDEMRALGLPCLIMVERHAYAQAARVLALNEDKLKRTLSDLGRQQSGSWRADQKLAALVAWTAMQQV